MRSLILPMSAAALALSGCAMTPSESARAAEAQSASRAALGQHLAGLSPGATQDCMDPHQSSSLKAYGPTLVYTVNRGLVYVNETGGGCEAVERGDILVTRSPTGRLCRGDIGTTVMSGSHVPSGSCSLGAFTVYHK